MRVVNTLKSIMDDLEASGAIQSYTYQSPSRVNVDLDTMRTPCGVMLCVTDRDVDIAQQTSRERSMVNIFFLTRQGSIDYDGTANDILIDQMTEVAFGFLSRLRLVDELHIVDDDVKLLSIYNEHDANTTGVNIQLTIEENQGHCMAMESTWWAWDTAELMHYDDSVCVKVGGDL